MFDMRNMPFMALVVLFALVVMTLFAVNRSEFAQAEGEPAPGSVSEYYTFTLYPETALTGSDTVYSDSPRTISGVDRSVWVGFNSADICATTDISTTGTMTVTAQATNLLSYDDATEWADLGYTWAGDSALTTQDYQMVLIADGTDCMRVPSVAERFRVKIEHSAAMTPTVRVTLKNNGGPTDNRR